MLCYPVNYNTLSIALLGVYMMKRLRKLNGWQRLWIVVAVCSLLYTLGYSFVEGAKQYRIEYDIISAFGIPECKHIVDMPSGYKLEQEPGYNSPCWHLYVYRSIYEDAKKTKEGYIQHMNSLQNILILQTMGIMLVLWLVSIGLLYGAGVIVAWVVKGFRSKPTTNGGN